VLLVGTQTNKKEKLITIDFGGLLHHTLIVGQSGGGKSFFVARLIEEILLRSKARLIILDPNGDFRQISKPSPTAWTKFSDSFNHMKSISAKASVPIFDEQDEFLSGWGKRRFAYLSSGRRRTPPREGDVTSTLVAHWDALDDEQRAFYLQANAQTDPRMFLALKAITENVLWKQSTFSLGSAGFNLRQMRESCELFLSGDINLRKYPYVKTLSQDDWSRVRASLDEMTAMFKIWWNPSANYEIAPRGISYYVDCLIQGKSSDSSYSDALVVSLEEAAASDSLLVADIVLSRCWHQAKAGWRRVVEGEQDRRVPTFIVIDEAHNFAPEVNSDPLRERVTKRLLQIASEGRKYGLYLILATQRPTKLHPGLVPECENACVLRLQSKRETDFAVNVLGLPENQAGSVPSFELGQGVFIGRWMGPAPVNAMIAPARISVGGGSLPDDWRSIPEATPEIDSLDAIRSYILERLEESEYPIPSAQMAASVLQEFGSLRGTWGGHGSFKKLVLELAIPDLCFSQLPPAYVYLSSRHELPETSSMEAGEIRDPTELILDKVRRRVSFQIGDSQATYKAVLQAISHEVVENGFNLTETSRNVRDRLVGEGVAAGRNLVNSVLKGIFLGGHTFEDGSDQSPSALAVALVRSITSALADGEGDMSDSDQLLVRSVFGGGFI
jgi:hypothetical protein